MKKIIGLDLGLKYFVTTSNGDRFVNPKFYNQYRNKIEELTKELLTKKRKASEKEKLKKEINTINSLIKQKREKFQEELANKIIKENDIILIEDLHIAEMIKNTYFSESIIQAAWDDFLDILYKKANKENKIIQKVGRYFPSTKKCSTCNSIKKKVSNRFWICKNCKTLHERDINAAINIKNEGLRLIQEKNKKKVTLILKSKSKNHL